MAPLIGLTSNYFDERYHEKAPDLMPLRDQGLTSFRRIFPAASSARAACP